MFFRYNTFYGTGMLQCWWNQTVNTWNNRNCTMRKCCKDSLKVCMLAISFPHLISFCHCKKGRTKQELQPVIAGKNINEPTWTQQSQQWIKQINKWWQNKEQTGVLHAILVQKERIKLQQQQHTLPAHSHSKQNKTKWIHFVWICFVGAYYAPPLSHSACVSICADKWQIFFLDFSPQFFAFKCKWKTRYFLNI